MTIQADRSVCLSRLRVWRENHIGRRALLPTLGAPLMRGTGAMARSAFDITTVPFACTVRPRSAGHHDRLVVAIQATRLGRLRT